MLNKFWRILSKIIAYMLVSAVFAFIVVVTTLLLAFIITLIVG